MVRVPVVVGVKAWILSCPPSTTASTPPHLRLHLRAGTLAGSWLRTWSGFAPEKQHAKAPKPSFGDVRLERTIL